MELNLLNISEAFSYRILLSVATLAWLSLKESNFVYTLIRRTLNTVEDKLNITAVVPYVFRTT